MGGGFQECIKAFPDVPQGEVSEAACPFCNILSTCPLSRVSYVSQIQRKKRKIKQTPPWTANAWTERTGLGNCPLCSSHETSRLER